jgi:hypothetical protein
MGNHTPPQQFKNCPHEYHNKLKHMHRHLQKVRLKLEPEPPTQTWVNPLNLTWNKPPHPLAEQILEAEYHCLEAATEVQGLIKEHRTLHQGENRKDCIFCSMKPSKAL